MSSERIITVNARKYDGSIHRTWKCAFVRRTDLLLELDGVFAETVVHGDLGTLLAGTLSREYYWLDKCFSVFVFTEPDGALRNYYCNINLPPTFEDNVLDYIDLDIDILVAADLSYRILDREEYEENSKKYGYSAEVSAKVESALAELERMIAEREFPFTAAAKAGCV
jgi:protein associated with RNAse G/E